MFLLFILRLYFPLENRNVLWLSCLPVDPFTYFSPSFVFCYLTCLTCQTREQSMRLKTGWLNEDNVCCAMLLAVWEGVWVTQAELQVNSVKITGTNQCDYKGQSLCSWIDFDYFLLNGNTDWFFQEDLSSLLSFFFFFFITLSLKNKKTKTEILK